MSNSNSQPPLIVESYERYLVDQDASAFAYNVSARYRVGTLERLAIAGDRMARRAAVLAIGLLGDYGSNAVLGKALIDRDRGVRTLAEGGICKLWRRVGNEQHRQSLDALIQLSAAEQYDECAVQASALIQQVPWFAEVWYQRSVANFHLDRFDESIRDCHQALEINPYHFAAAAGMGRSLLSLGDRAAALEAFRRALRLNPSQEDVRAHVALLQRALSDE